MNIIRSELERRLEEFDSFRSFLARLDRDGTQVAWKDSTDGTHAMPVPALFLSISRASLLLILYNLTESTVRLAFEAAIEEIHQDGCSVMNARRELRDLWSRLKSRALIKSREDNWAEKLQRIVEEALAATPMKLQKEEVFKAIEGNFAADQIREICRCFGMSFSPSLRCKGGYFMDQVKSARNHLGHGTYTFSDIGAELTLDELRSFRNQIRYFLLELLDSIEAYLQGKIYLVGALPNQ